MYCTESSEQHAQQQTQLQPHHQSQHQLQHMSNCMQLQDSSNNDESVAHTISGMCFMAEQPEALSVDCNATTVPSNLDAYAFTPFTSNIGSVPFSTSASLTDGYTEEYTYYDGLNGIVDGLASLVPKPSDTNRVQLQQQLLQQQQLQKQLKQIYYERQQTLRQLQQQYQQLLHLAAMVQSQNSLMANQQQQLQQVTCNCMTQHQQQSSTGRQQESTVPVDCSCLLSACNCMQQTTQTKQHQQRLKQQATNSKLCSRSLQTLKQTNKPEQSFEQTILRLDLPCLLDDSNCNILGCQQQQQHQQQMPQLPEQQHASQCQTGATIELDDKLRLSTNLISHNTQQPQNLLMKIASKSNWSAPSDCMCGSSCVGSCTKNNGNYAGSNNNLKNFSQQKGNGSSSNNTNCMKSGCPQCGCWHFPRCSNWFWHPCIDFIRLAGDNSSCKNSVCNQRR